METPGQRIDGDRTDRLRRLSYFSHVSRGWRSSILGTMLFGFFVALLIAFWILVAAGRRHGRLLWMRGSITSGAVVLSIASVALLSWQTFAPQFGEPKKADELPGAQVFRDSGCVRCHTIGGGRKNGPDLAGVGNRLRRGDLIDLISDPDAYYRSRDLASINRGYPKMPSLGIPEDSAEDVADFLIAKTRQNAP